MGAIMKLRLVSAIAAIGMAVFCTGAMAQTAQSNAPPNLATVHAQQSKFACNACHGDKTPTSVSAEEALATVNQNCISCHGDAKAMAAVILPKLVHKEINPHAAHLVEIDCVTCHHGHSAGEAYCQQCHAFDMTMPPKANK
jgi:fumarate reductase flavoprotein subunit